MAIQSATEAFTPDSMGDTIFGMDAGQDEISGTRLLFFHYRKPRHAHILYGCSSDTVLVRAHVSG